MRFTYNQYKYYESGYRIPSKMHNLNHHHGNSNGNSNSNSNNNNTSSSNNNNNNTNSNHHHYNNNNSNNNNNNNHNNSNNNSNTNAYQHHQHHYKSNFGMRMTMSTNSTMSPRIHRKTFRIPSKRQPGKGLPGKLHTISRTGPGKLVPGKRIPQRPHPPPCDNSNDSGLGFDQHLELQNGSAAPNLTLASQSGQVNSALTSSVAAAAAAAAAAVASSSLQQQRHQQQQQASPSHPQQHSPQQHLIRAIPVSRSRHAKKMPYLMPEEIEPLTVTATTTATLDEDTDTGFGNDTQISSSNSQDQLFNGGGGGIFKAAAEVAAVAATATFAVQQQMQQQQQQCQYLQNSLMLQPYSNNAQQQQLPQQQQQHQQHPQIQQQQQRSGKHIKRKKLECNHVELDNDDACSEDEFIRKIANAVGGGGPEMAETSATATAATQPAAIGSSANIISVQTLLNNSNNNSNNNNNKQQQPKFISTRAVTRVASKRQPTTPLNSIASSNDGRVQLEIVSQPEQQHRARYQTEGSRGAVKDRSGNGFPIVRLTGYGEATKAVLQVFIGTDIGRVAPHMFYQACKVAGKNSTQCNEKKVDGTMVIEIDFKPETEMTITCDCVGILKERNVDVEHRFPEHLSKNKKKSTRCRMVFRTQLTRDDGSTETLQVCSNPIICTQPPGVPEICKKSLNSCPVDGGLELFIIGKNFLKDTHVVFQETYDSVNADDPATEIAVRQQLIGGTAALWEASVLPDKEYLHQTHLICTVPPYLHQNLLKPVAVQVSIVSSGKKSEPHTFTYTPKGSYTTLAAASTLSSTMHGTLASNQDVTTYMDTSAAPVGVAVWPATAAGVAVGVVETKHEIDSGMMPPPITTQIPMGVRRASLPSATPMITDQQLVHLNAVASVEALKSELLEDSSSHSPLPLPLPLSADSMHSPEALSPCSPSANALQYYARKNSGGAMDAIMYDQSNSLAAAVDIDPAAVAVAVELAVKNEIVKHVVQQQQQQQQQHQQQQQQQQHQQQQQQFIDDLTKSTSVVSSNGSSEPALFSSSSVMGHSLSDMLQQEVGVAPSTLERSLSMSSNNSNSGGEGSPANGGHSSPLTQDIILNSEPAAALGALPMQPGVDANAVGALSTDIIMNPAVSPSTILCSANGAATAVVPNIMAPHQVTMANSILNDIAMQPEPTQQDAAVAALALSNIMMSPPNASAVADALPPTPATAATATSTAVSNLIIKAAADFITTQEQQQQHSHHHHHQHQQQQHSHHHHHQHHHQHHQHQQQHQQQQQQSSASSAGGGDPLVNLLLNQPESANEVGFSSHTHAHTHSHTHTHTHTQQESLIVALATENALQQSVATAAVTTNGAVMTQQASAPNTAGSILPAAVGAVAAAAAAAVPLPPPIPQELTTMSDQDLISYINPSTFDQL